MALLVEGYNHRIYKKILDFPENTFLALTRSSRKANLRQFVCLSLRFKFV